MDVDSAPLVLLVETSPVVIVLEIETASVVEAEEATDVEVEEVIEVEFVDPEAVDVTGSLIVVASVVLVVSVGKSVHAHKTSRSENVPCAYNVIGNLI